MPKHTNLVFIFSDQQRYDTMACYGNDWIKTPNLNALSEESFIFERAYVSQPVCTPARATIVTGLYPHNSSPMNVIALTAEHKSIAEYLPEGYATAWYGKWHLGNDQRAQHGFEHWVTYEDDYSAFVDMEGEPLKSDYHNYLVAKGYEPDSYRAQTLRNVPPGVLRNIPDNWKVFSNEQRSTFPAEDKMAHFLGREAANFITEHGDEPFVLYVSTFEPHSPFNGPYNDLYDPASLPTGPAFLKKPLGGALISRLRADAHLQLLEHGPSSSHDGHLDGDSDFNDISSEYGWRQLRARYFANVTLVDDMVGMITDALKEQGIFDDTVIAFTSEHGEMVGDHGFTQKMSMYEESSRVPLIVRAPAISTDKTVIGGNVSHVDLVPTLLDLLGCDVPDSVDGKSVAKVMEDKGNLRNNEVYIEWNGIGWIDTGISEDGAMGVIVQGKGAHGTPEMGTMYQAPWRTIVQNDWKLNLCATDQCELYNLREDPHEMNNLYDHPDHRDVVRLLSTKIRAWQFRTRDDAPL